MPSCALLGARRSENGRYADRLASWIEHELVPRLGARLGPSSSAGAETVVLRAMAGPGAGRPTRLGWEGLAYDVDPAEAEYRRLRAIRRRQSGPTLEEALAAGAIVRRAWPPRLTDLAYATALGPAEGAPAASEDVARRHGFAFEEPQPLGDRAPEWTVPREVGGRASAGMRKARCSAWTWGWPASPCGASRRRPARSPPQRGRPPCLRRGRSAGPAAPRLDDATRDRIAEGLGRGRARIAEAVTDPATLERVIADLRLRTGAAAPSLPSPRTIPRISSPPSRSAIACGWVEGERPATAAAWGTARDWDDGCLCPRLARLAPLDDLAGRTADGRLAALSPDLHLRVAELMAEMKLPARLAPAILGLAVQDLMDEAEPAYLDDALAIARYARGLKRTRTEDYVAALVGRGPLLPVAEP